MGAPLLPLVLSQFSSWLSSTSSLDTQVHMYWRVLHQNHNIVSSFNHQFPTSSNFTTFLKIMTNISMYIISLFLTTTNLYISTPPSLPYVSSNAWSNTIQKQHQQVLVAKYTCCWLHPPWSQPVSQHAVLTPVAAYVPRVVRVLLIWRPQLLFALAFLHQKRARHVPTVQCANGLSGVEAALRLFMEWHDLMGIQRL